MGPHFLKTVAAFCAFLETIVSCEVTATWQWFNWTLAQIPDGKKPLLLNMDETACCLFYDGASGVLASEPIALQARRGLLAQNATRGQTRSNLSLVALLCEDSAIQAELPQYIIGNEHVVPAAVVAQLHVEGALLPNVRLQRKKSAWVNDAVLAVVARHWGEVLSRHRAERQPILLVDSCNAHLGRKFLAACARAKIWVVCVPARLTWLMQPADTHCFALLKAWLRKAFHEALLANENGKVFVKEMILQVNMAIRKVLQGRRWKNAFVSNGYAPGQRHVRAKILELLEWDTTPSVSSELPCFADFQALFPRRREIPLKDLLACHRARPAAPGAPPEPEVPVAPEPIAERGIWFGRLRSSSHLIDPTPPAISQPSPSSSSSSSVLPAAPTPWLPGPPSPRPARPPPRRLFPVGRPLLPPQRRPPAPRPSPY